MGKTGRISLSGAGAVALAIATLAAPAFAGAQRDNENPKGTLGATVQAPRAAENGAGYKLNPEPFVRSVLAQNPDVAAIEAAHDAAKARIVSAGALDDPMIAYESAPESIGANMGYRQNVQVSQNIPWPGTLDLRSNAASADADSARYRVADLRLQLASQARAAFADWYYVHRALAINADDIKLVQRLKSVAEAAYASAQAPQQDVLQAEVELVRLENQKLELERRRRAVQAAMNGLLNADPTAEVALPGDLPQPKIARSYAELQNAALGLSAALKSSDADLAASRARVDLAEKAFYPSFTLMAEDNTRMAKGMQVAVGIGVNIPIGAGHTGDLEAASANLRQSRAKLASARAKLLSGLDETYATVRQMGDTIDLYDKRLLPLAALNLKAAEADYRSGEGDFLKLIVAEQQYLAAELERESARAGYYTQFAKLDYLAGGELFAAGEQDIAP